MSAGSGSVMAVTILPAECLAGRDMDSIPRYRNVGKRNHGNVHHREQRIHTRAQSHGSANKGGNSKGENEILDSNFNESGGLIEQSFTHVAISKSVENFQRQTPTVVKDDMEVIHTNENINRFKIDISPHNLHFRLSRAVLATSNHQNSYQRTKARILLFLVIISGFTCLAPGRSIENVGDLHAERNHGTHGKLLEELDSDAPLVPGFYIFGDSTVDSGNNNFLITFARANMPPYGRDFDTHTPTGRFSNGRISVDYLASYMGLPLIPTVLGTKNVTSMTSGLNYASAGAGILLQTGSDLGQHISFNEQLGLFSNSEAKMSLILGQSATKETIRKSIFYFSIGNNDFIHYYLRNVSGILEKQSSTQFSSMLLENLSNHLKFLIGGGIGKVVLVGIGPLGCAPNFLYAYNSSSGDCISEINSMVKEFNLGLALLTAELRAEFPDANIIFCDIFDGFYDIVINAPSYGFENTNTACCGAGKYGGWVSCLIPELACSDASKYIFWDAFHPTEKVDYLTSLSIWNGTVCSPISVQELAVL